MKSKYPDCPEELESCSFIQGVTRSTCLHSPIAYNRRGEPVSGGTNVHTEALHCTHCNRTWHRKRSDLEIAKGISPDWKLS